MPQTWTKGWSPDTGRFTYLASRAVHIGMSHIMTTDSFIQALRRLITRRGNVRQICSDNWSGFVGAEQDFNEIQWDRPHKDSMVSSEQ